jgi:hypothetical protein
VKRHRYRRLVLVLADAGGLLSAGRLPVAVIDTLPGFPRSFGGRTSPCVRNGIIA